LYALGKNGHLDLTLVERFIQCVGVYPVGSCVALNTREIGIVSRPNHEQPLSPTLVLIRDEESRPIGPPRVLNLAMQTGQPVMEIVSVLNPAELGIDVARYLDHEDGSEE